MGCGHSKINIYPKRNKGCSKKSTDVEETKKPLQESIENETDVNDKSDEDRKTIKVKPVGGSPLIINTQLSNSQNNFFKMLEEKIENGPDYDSNSEKEKALEQARIRSLLRNWETAKHNSRSLPNTPRRRIIRDRMYPQEDHSLENAESRSLDQQRIYNPHSPLMVHQQQQPYIPTSKDYIQLYQGSEYYHLPPTQRSYPVQPPPIRRVPYNQQGSPIKYISSSPKQDPTYSPNHKVYNAVIKNRYSNDDIILQHIYQQHSNYEPSQNYITGQSTRNYQRAANLPTIVPTDNINSLT